MHSVNGILFLFTLLALVFDGFDIQAIGFIAPALLAEWDISRAKLGPVLAAGLVGMALGAIALGPLGDRIGRKRSLLAAMGLIAAGSLASAFVQDPLQLTICRFFTGLGLGGCLPNATALIMEFAPLTLRNLMVSVTIVGVPVGGVLGAAVAARLLPEFGWRAIVMVGAILPALLALVMWIVMPESPRFLARLSSFLGSVVAAMGDGVTAFFIGIAAVVALTGSAVACFGRQIPASR
jgi:AAHS family 4-hydroxybenzoate transporter-like MFS transporter